MLIDPNLLERCSPDKQAEILLKVYEREEKRKARSQFWSQFFRGIETTLAIAIPTATLCILLNPVINKSLTDKYIGLGWTVSVGTKDSAQKTNRKVILPTQKLSNFKPQEKSSYPEFSIPRETPARGEKIAGYRITDYYRIRPIHPYTGQRNVWHRGVDVGTPIGTPIRAIGAPDSTVTVTCGRQGIWGIFAVGESPSLPGWSFIYHHLSRCRPGKYTAGAAIGSTGTAGTGPHLHFGVKYRGDWVAPPKKFVEASLTGKISEK